ADGHLIAVGAYGFQREPAALAMPAVEMHARVGMDDFHCAVALPRDEICIPEWRRAPRSGCLIRRLARGASSDHGCEGGRKSADCATIHNGTSLACSYSDTRSAAGE